ncbi:MAG: inositol monophosphatase [Coxiella sp. RIFCSPHIGHO2_12_FULL_44_14]|nr:MAG: inositol monophosphatase [Coxiella sp. RIFCSPHIGHO2_12_FULL_44_14]
MHPLLNIAIQAARSAGKVIVRFMDRLEATDITEKGRNDFVTTVDQYAEQEIIQIIRKSYPEHSILAEESGLDQRDEHSVWIIDPLDGTTNFIHGFPQFAVSIACRQQGKLEVGVIYDPIRQELFTAVRGAGAQLNHRRIRVSTCHKFEHALIGTGFPYRKTQPFQAYLKTLAEILPRAAGLRRAGAAALDLAYVAAGRLDGFWETALHEWDMAAGVLLIKEAGGFVGDFAGGDDYLASGNIIVGNTAIYPLLSSLVRKSWEEEGE